MEKNAIKKTLLLLCLLGIYLVLVYFLMPLLAGYLFGEVNKLIISIFNQIITIVIPTILVLILTAKKNEDETVNLLFKIDSYFKTKNKPIDILKCVVLGISMYFAVQYLFFFIENLYIYCTDDYSFVTILPEFDFLSFVLLFVSACLIPSIFEELLYRGMYFDTFKDKKLILQIMIPTVVFMFLHNGIFSALSAMILSLILFFLMRKKMSLILCILVHFIYNLMSVIFSNIVMLPFGSLQLLTNYASGQNLLGGAFVSLGISMLFVAVVAIVLKSLFKTNNNDKFIVLQTNECAKTSTKEMLLIAILTIVPLIVFILRLSL